jgi:hypothetical protein
VPQNVVQIAGDALALGHFGEVLNFVVGHAQLGQSTVALGKIDVAATDDRGQSTRVKEEPARQVEDPGFDRSQYDDPGHQRNRRALGLHAERDEGRGKDKEGRSPSIDGREYQTEDDHAGNVP